MLVVLGFFGVLAAASGAREFDQCYTILGPEQSGCSSAEVLSNVALVALGIFAMATLIVALVTLVPPTVEAPEGTSEASRDSSITGTDGATPAAIDPRAEVRAPYRRGLAGVLERISDHLGIGFEDDQPSPKK